MKTGMKDEGGRMTARPAARRVDGMKTGMQDEGGRMKACDKDGCCKFLAERCSDGGKGFQMLEAFKIGPDVTEFAARFVGVRYRMNGKDRGLMLNWCPFCGGQPGDFKRADDCGGAKGRAP